jgi:CHAT domain-containing protein
MLGLLPIHAAGYHTDPASEPGRRTVMDRVVSSYTPTIRALRYARQHSHLAEADAVRALIVAMSTTPGIPGRLPNVSAEVAMLTRRMPEALVLSEPEPPASGSAARLPTKANVLASLPGHAIAHFACHGASDSADPSSSLLLLHDHQTDPLTVASLAAVKLDQVQLAYLSACRTAFGAAAGLMDEAIHLTSAFQLAGFPHVVGTLWPINDAIAVQVAGTFYTALHSGNGTLDINRAAYALHHSIRTARDSLPNLPSLWAAYLHAGT